MPKETIQINGIKFFLFQEPITSLSYKCGQKIQNGIPIALDYKKVTKHNNELGELLGHTLIAHGIEEGVKEVGEETKIAISFYGNNKADAVAKVRQIKATEPLLFTLRTALKEMR